MPGSRLHHLIRLIVLFSIVLLILASNSISLLAQGETTPEVTEPASEPSLTPTATPLPTETPVTPTDAPVPTASETATASPSPTSETEQTPEATQETTVEATTEVTPEITTEATSEVTASPTATETPTLSPTATLLPEPPLSLLFSDTFDTGQLYTWEVGQGWSLVASEGGQALQASGNAEPVSFLYDTLYNIAVQTRVQMTSGVFRLSIRQSEVGSYSVILDASGQVALYGADQLLGWATVSPFTVGEWRTIRLSAVEDGVRVAIDGTEVIATSVVAALPPGGIFFAASTTGTDVTLVDDFYLWIPTTEMPAPTATATLNPEPEMQLYLKDSFEGFDLDYWRLNGTWTPRLTIEHDPTLFADNTAASAILGYGSFTDVTVNAKIQLDDGSFKLSVRHSESGDYSAILSSDGQVALYRGAEFIDSTMVSSPNTWTVLGISSINNLIRVSLDDVELISFLDTNPLPAGEMIFASMENSSVAVDLVEVFVPSDYFQSEETASTSGEALASISSSSRIAYSVRSVECSEIHTIDLTGSIVEVTNIVPQNPCILDSYPSWSPDGSQIAFASSRRDPNYLYYDGIFVVNSDVVNAQPSDLTVVLSPQRAYQENIFTINDLAWSPDGNKIAFIGYHGPNNTSAVAKLWLIEPNGNNLELVVNTFSLPGNLNWTPDGQKLIYSCGSPNNHLCTTNINTATETHVLGVGRDAALSPDGTKVAVIPQSGSSNGNLIVRSMDDLSGTLLQLTFLTGGNRYVGDPTWSPDGSQIAFASSNDISNPHSPAMARVYVVPSDGSGTMQRLNLTEGSEGDSNLAWEPLICIPSGLAVQGADALLAPVCQPIQAGLVDYNIYLIDQNGQQIPDLDTKSQTVLVAARKVGEAFLPLSSIDLDDEIPFPEEGEMTFRRIMVGDASYLTRDSNDPVIAVVFYSQRPTVDCQTYNIGGNPADAIDTVPQAVRDAIAANLAHKDLKHQSVIGCSTAVTLTEYTIAHEFGHVFDGMATDSQFSDKVTNTQDSDQESDPPIRDQAFFCSEVIPGYPDICPTNPRASRSLIVMGSVFVDGIGTYWTRGERGWGSAPPTSPANLTPFQQHYLPTPPYLDLFEAIQETTADMFLNWVYRKIDANGQQTQLAPGNWNGFLNLSWSHNDPRWGACDVNSCIDYSFPGDARYTWMNGIILQFFSDNGW